MGVAPPGNTEWWGDMPPEDGLATSVLWISRGRKQTLAFPTLSWLMVAQAKPDGRAFTYSARSLAFRGNFSSVRKLLEHHIQKSTAAEREVRAKRSAPTPSSTEMILLLELPTTNRMNRPLACIESLLGAKHCSKCFTCASSNPQYVPTR